MNEMSFYRPDLTIFSHSPQNSPQLNYYYFTPTMYFGLKTLIKSLLQNSSF